MLQDVLKGRPTEIDAINGKIVERGRAVDVPTPINATLTALVRALERNLTAQSAERAKKAVSRILEGQT
jgi:2-dehydropantoate 2-reductase